MRYWIEVTSGIRWERLLKSGIVLKAQNTTRYKNFFKNVGAGDWVLHYLTHHLTPDAEKGSCVIALSKVATPPRSEGKSILANCSDTVELRKPIPVKKLLEIESKSEGFNKLAKTNMQRYLTEITNADFESILNIYVENKKLFEAKR